MPVARGKIAGVVATLTSTWKAAPCRIRPRFSSPNSKRGLVAQRSVTPSSGGSETTINPPIRRNLAPHSAVTAGGPNDLAVTKSKDSSILESRAISSIRPEMTSPDSGASVHSRISRRKLTRFFIESVSTHRRRQWSSSTSAGRPPPLPRSSSAAGGDEKRSSQHAAKPSACAIWGSIGPGPKKPRALDSSRARFNQSFVTC